MDHQAVFAQLINQLQRKLGVFDQCQVSCCGISQAQCFTLGELGRTEGISLGELSNRLGVDNSTMSRTVNSLVNCGLIQRVPDPADRRYVVLTLTAEGKKIATDIDVALNRQFTRVWQAIVPNKREQVMESLGIIVDALGKGCCQ